VIVIRASVPMMDRVIVTPMVTVTVIVEIGGGGLGRKRRIAVVPFSRRSVVVASAMVTSNRINSTITTRVIIRRGGRII